MKTSTDSQTAVQHNVRVATNANEVTTFTDEDMSEKQNWLSLPDLKEV